MGIYLSKRTRKLLVKLHKEPRVKWSDALTPIIPNYPENPESFIRRLRIMIKRAKTNKPIELPKLPDSKNISNFLKNINKVPLYRQHS